MIIICYVDIHFPQFQQNQSFFRDYNHGDTGRSILVYQTHYLSLLHFGS